MKTYGKLALLWLLLAIGVCTPVRAEAIRELVTIQGAVPVTLEGIGLLTGLANTGDKKVAAQEMLQKYLSNRNLDFERDSLSLGNIAIVRVKAEMPPFSRPGQKFAVSVTSIGDAKSLEGGELLDCDLFDGSSELPVARATGQVIVGPATLTRGTIPAGQSGGALQLAVYEFGQVISREGVIRLNLNRPNWADAWTIANQINQTPSLNPSLQETTMFAEAQPIDPVAYPKDAGQIYLRVPEIYRAEVTRYIASVLDVPISVDRPARIVVNRAKNSIVVTGDIRVSNAVVSLQDKMVTVRPETPEFPAAYTLENDTPRNMVEIDGPGTYADLQGLIDTLNAMGLSTAQVITMFEQLREAGAINAEFVNL